MTMKTLHLELVRVTEAGAIAASELVGMGDKLQADKLATEAIQHRLNKIDFAARVAIGEGIKDKSIGLWKGEVYGIRREDYPQKFIPYEIAIDPIEGTRPVAEGGYEAMSTIALGSNGAFYDGSCYYMKKIAIGSEIASKLDRKLNVTEDVGDIIRKVYKVLERTITVCLLDRPRHAELIAELRGLGCRIKLIQDCDISACIAVCVPESGIDVYMGVGGTPEGVISAAALKCMKGYFQGQLSEKDGTPTDDRLLWTEDLAKGNVIFSATGITDGSLLNGVRYTRHGITTHSITMRSESGTVRRIETRHGN